jgi:putative AlgH/UPF0301 family transcriptional regulator
LAISVEMALVTRFVYSLWLLGVPGLAFMSTFRRSIRSANAYTLRATTIGVETNTGPKSIAPLKEACAGAVLIAHPGEYSHYLMQACVFLFEGGPDRGYQGVILESPTSFTIGEMAAAAVGEELGRNTLFTGGEDGEDTAIMLSSHDMGGLTRPCGERSNVFVGGLGAAKRLVESGAAPASDFKFFFRSCIWEKGILEKEVETGRWMVAEVPMTDVLTQVSKRLFCLPVYPSVCLFVCLCVCLSVYLSIYLSVCLFTYLLTSALPLDAMQK